MKKFPILYAKASNGKTKMWEIFVEDPATIVTRHGYEDGEVSEHREVISEGKVNRSAVEQAISEAQSKWKKKIDKKYAEKGKRSHSIILPMLAQKYNERKHYITFPCYVQPKLNGYRITTKIDDGITFTTRGGKPAEFKHIEDSLLRYNNIVLDGEIYKHGLLLQRIIELGKKYRPESETLEYWIYDVIGDGTFEERFVNNTRLIRRPMKNIRLVPTYKVNNESEIFAKHKEFVKDGFEGTIIRNANGLYRQTHRSNDLLKLKNFLDDEFKITGGHEDVEGGVVFELVTKEGKPFNCRPNGTLEQRKEWLKDINNLKKKLLSISFQSWSKDKIPTIFTETSIRDYE